MKAPWCLSLPSPTPRSKGSWPHDQCRGRVFCLYRQSPFPPGLKCLPLSFSKFGPAQTLDPVSCPHPSVLAATAGGPPLSPRSRPQRKSSSFLQAGNYRMFLLEFFGFHIAECSSLISHRPPFPAGRQFFCQRRAWTSPPLTPPPSPMFAASQTKYAKEPRRTNRK